MYKTEMTKFLFLDHVFTYLYVYFDLLFLRYQSNEQLSTNFQCENNCLCRTQGNIFTILHTLNYLQFE